MDSAAIKAPSPILTLSEPNMDVLTATPKFGTVWSVSCVVATTSFLAAGAFWAGSLLTGELAIVAAAGSAFCGCGICVCGCGGCGLGAAGALLTGTVLAGCSCLGRS